MSHMVFKKKNYLALPFLFVTFPEGLDFPRFFQGFGRGGLCRRGLPNLGGGVDGWWGRFVLETKGKTSNLYKVFRSF